MSGERIKRYWCDDCNCFVKKDHRCQQWDTVYMMPEDAFKDLESQLSKVIEERDRAVELLRWFMEQNYACACLGECKDKKGRCWKESNNCRFRVTAEFLSSLTENKS